MARGVSFTMYALKSSPEIRAPCCVTVAPYVFRLLFVGDAEVGRVMEEERRVLRRLDGDERARCLREIEAVGGGRGRARVGGGELTEAVRILGEAQHARRLVGHVRHVVLL